MESTGVYWIPVYEILEQRGFEVILVNARYAKNVPGRKPAEAGGSSASP
jgi:transposase